MARRRSLTFDPHTPSSELAVLREEISRLPGVQSARLCRLEAEADTCY